MPTLYQIFTSIGIASSIASFIYIGKKLQILDDLKDSSGKIKINLDVVCRYLTKHHNKFDSSELKTFSPFQLTKKGNDFIENIGFDKVFAEHKKSFLDFIDSENPKLKYDVENTAIKSIAALYEEPYMEFLKIYFYNHPERDLQNTAPTLGVYIRDRYLEDHPEIIK